MTNFEYAETWKREQRQFLAKVVAQTESPLEALFATALLAESDGEDGYAIGESWRVQMTPQREVLVGNDTYRIDFAIEVRDIMKVAVEIDGHDTHQATEETRTATKHRSSDLERAGWSVIHLPGYRVSKSPRECVAEVLNEVRRIGLIWEARRWKRVEVVMDNRCARSLLIAELVRVILYFYCQNPWLLEEPCLDQVAAVLPANAALVVAAERQSLLAGGALDAEEFIARCPAFFTTTASEYVNQGRLLLESESEETAEERRAGAVAIVANSAESILALRETSRPVGSALAAILDIVSVIGAAKEAHNGRGLDVLRRTHETRTYVDRLCKLDGEIDQLEQLAKDLWIHTHA